MDSDNLVPANWVDTAQSDNLVSNKRVDMVHQNGVHEPSPANGGNDASRDVNGSGKKVTMSLGPNDSVDSASKLDDSAANDSVIGEVGEGSNEFGGSNGLSASKKGQMRDADHPQLTKPQCDPQKCKTEKASDAQKVSATQMKKGKNGEGGQLTVTNASASHSRSKQPVKSKSFHEKQAQVPKQSEKSDMTSMEGLEKEKIKTLKKNPVVRSEEDTLSSPTARDIKPHRFGVLPNYGFSFKCDERAEKRKEFNSKLEEKIHAKEVERTTLQAQSKETLEAEIKMFRKSLNFKATPMPSFYQEPPPPKVELKKIPTTRPKSPKLGRRKSSSPANIDKGNIQSTRTSRLSLDEKMSHNNSVKGLSPVPHKKPQRKSLPKLPSEKTNIHATNNKRIGLSESTDGKSAHQKIENNRHSDGEEAAPKTEASETESQVDEEAAVEEETGPDLVEEPMAQ